MAAKGGDRPSVHPSDGFADDPTNRLRYFRPKNKGFERVEPTGNCHTAEQVRAKIPLEEGWGGLGERTEMPMKRIMVMTCIEQEVGLEGAR